jgi:polar amino acid transport system substrate-binding protein
MTRKSRAGRASATAAGVLVGLLLLAVAFGVVACGDDTADDAASPAASGSSTSSISASFTPVVPDTLTVVGSLPSPMFWDAPADDPTNPDSGLEWALANLMKDKLGLSKMVFRNENFDAIVAGQAGDFDIALSEITITPERDKVVDFTTPYYLADQGIMMRKGESVSTWDEVKDLVIGIQVGTTGGDFVLNTVKPNKDPQVFQNMTSEATAALEAGQIDAVIFDLPILMTLAADGDRFELVGKFVTNEEWGGLLPEGSPNKAAFDEIIQGALDDGTIAQLNTEYLGGDPGAIPVIEQQ